MFFQIDREQPLRFEANPKLTEVRILSALEVNPDALVDEYLYGIRVRVLRGTETIWDRTFYEKTRVTQIEGPDGRLLEDIRDPTDAVKVTDRRVTDVYLGHAAEEGDFLEIFLVASVSSRAFVRAYQKELLSVEEVQQEWKRMSDEERKERMAISAIPPSMLNHDELFQLLRRNYLTVPPEGIAGKDYVGHSFILRDEPITYRDYLYGDQAAVFEVGGGRQMAINLCGRGIVRFAFPGFQPQAGVTRKVSIYVVNERYGARTYNKPISAKEGESRIEIQTRDKCSSLILEYPYPESIPVRAFFLERGARDQPKNWKEQFPDYSATRGYLCRPFHDPSTPPQPVRSTIPQGQEFIVVRSILIIDPEQEQPETYTYRFAFLDSDQNVLQEGDIQPEVEPAALIRFPAGGLLAEAIPSEPHYTYFKIPKGADSLAVVSESPVLFFFQSTYVGRDLIEKKIPEDQKPIIINKDAIEFEPQWFYIRPADHQKLEIDGLSLSVLTQQVRIVITRLPLPVDDTQGLVLHPKGADSRIAVLETARIEPRHAAKADQSWYRPLPSRLETTLTVPEQAYGGRPLETELYYQCPPKVSPSPVLLVDGNPIRRLTPSNTLIKTESFALEPGEPTISLQGCPGGTGFLRLLTPPAPGADVAKDRGYYRWNRDTVMEIPFRKPDHRNVAVNLVFYANDGTPGRFTVDAWLAPGHRLASYAYEPPPYRVHKYSINKTGPDRGACMHFTGCRLSARQTMALPLNSWYPPGDYILMLRLTEGTEALVRFFMYSTLQRIDPLRSFYRE